MSSYRVTIQMMMHIDDIEALRPMAHQEMKLTTERHGSVAPNEFADNDQQAADYVAQHDRTVVTMAVIHALRVGGADLPVGVTIADAQVQNEPVG